MSTLLLMLMAIAFSCNNKTRKQETEVEGKNYLQHVTMNMLKSELLQHAGKPDSIVDLGRVTDENNYTQHIETYFYGNNQSVTIINDTVCGIDYNIKQTQARLQRRIDSARAAQH